MASNNELPVTSKQTKCYQAQVNRQDWKLSQTECTHDNSSMLTLCLLFYAQALVYSVATLLAFTSVCRQKTHHIACYMRFPSVHELVLSCILYSNIFWQFYMPLIIQNYSSQLAKWFINLNPYYGLFLALIIFI